jgi:hypothetical protein
VLHLSQSPPSPPASPSADRHPPPYHAAQDKLHAVQEGEEPSYAAVASGASHPQEQGTKPRRARKGSGSSETAVVPRYWIQKQQDLYQTTELLKFIPFAPASALAGFWQLLATLFCVFAVAMLRPFLRAALPAAAKSGTKKR